MMTQDPNVNFRDLAWSRPGMCELLNDHVLPRLYPGKHVTDVKRTWTAYKPGKDCLVLYKLSFDENGSNGHALAAATFGRPARLEQLYERHYKDGNGGNAVFLPDYPCLVEFFPTDWKLPVLAAATDADQAARLLAAALGERDIPRVVSVESLRYRPHRRCVLRYQLEWPGGKGPEQLIAKAYPAGAKAGHVRDKLAILGGQCSSSDLRFPRGYAAPDAPNLLIMECVPGTCMGELLEATTTESEARDVIEMALSALVAFHDLELTSDDRRTLPTEFDQLVARTARLHNAAPDLAAEVEKMLARFEPLIERHGDAEQCLIHGDFKPTQLMVDGRQAALVDLDRACPGDPAIDVGNFMAVMQKAAHIQNLGHAEPLSKWFLGEYEKRTGRGEVGERARVFEALALVRMIVRKFERAPHKYTKYGRDWPALSLLGHAAERLRTLAGGETT